VESRSHPVQPIRSRANRAVQLVQ